MSATACPQCGYNNLDGAWWHPRSLSNEPYNNEVFKSLGLLAALVSGSVFWIQADGPSWNSGNIVFGVICWMAIALVCRQIGDAIDLALIKARR
jgi:hypothetical protein